jgi:hypothetical protein
MSRGLESVRENIVWVMAIKCIGHNSHGCWGPCTNIARAPFYNTHGMVFILKILIFNL